jgi:hypothetical protein
MTTKKITLNADKRKVIADQFQSFFEDKINWFKQKSNTTLCVKKQKSLLKKL